MSRSAQVYRLPAHKQLAEPRLRFGALDSEALDTHPLRRLAAFDPFSKHPLVGVVNPIRIAFIGQRKMVDRLNQLLKEIEQSHEPRDGGRVYRPSFPGFSAVFGSRLTQAPDAATIVLPDSLARRRVKSQAGVHLEFFTSPGRTLCGFEFDPESHLVAPTATNFGKQQEPFLPTAKRVVTCPHCVTVGKVCQTVQFES